MMGASGIVSAKSPLTNVGTDIAGTYVNYSNVVYPACKQTGVLETSTTTSGRYYTFNVTYTGLTYQSQPMSVLETLFNPVTISAVAQGDKTNLLSVVNPIAAGIGSQQIYIELAVINAGNTEAVVDAVRVWYSPSFSAGIEDDILKMGNFGENISSYRSGKKFIVENRPMITDKDTIFLRSSNLTVNSYRFKINTFDFVQTNVAAFLIDNYLKIATALNLTGAADALDFAVTADAASANPDRFMIVFAANKLQPSGMYILAAQQNNLVAVDCKVSSQLAVAPYGVEK